MGFASVPFLVPNVITFLPGDSGNYTPSPGTRFLRVRAIAGGGGGMAGSGNAGDLGVATVFGNMSLNPGTGGGAASRPPGGAAIVLPSGVTGLSLPGADGGSGTNNDGSGQMAGTLGASSAFGGGGACGGETPGSDATVPGAGGGGGGFTGTNSWSGSGGSAGAYIDVFITPAWASWGSPIAYSVGTGGIGGGGVGTGWAGGDGAGGIIEIEEH